MGKNIFILSMKYYYHRLHLLNVTVNVQGSKNTYISQTIKLILKNTIPLFELAYDIKTEHKKTSFKADWSSSKCRIFFLLHKVRCFQEFLKQNIISRKGSWFLVPEVIFSCILPLKPNSPFSTKCILIKRHW